MTPDPAPALPRVAAVPPSTPRLGDAIGSGRIGLLDAPLPRYPEQARRTRAQGTTVLKVRVLETGRPGEIQVEESAGYQVLDDAARDAVRRWRFAPGREDGKLAALWVLIPIVFQMR